MGCSSRGAGQYVASEVSVAQWGRLGKAGQRGVLYLQGSHALADAYLGDATGRALSDAGFISVCGDLSQTSTQGTYGNDTAVTRTGQLRTFIQGTLAPVAAASGKVHIFGVSGGGTAALNYARANAGNVASLYLLAPAVDLLAIYNTPARLAYVSLTQAEMNKAYNAGVDDGGTAFLAAMATHDPSASGNQAALASVPIKLVYSDDDGAVTPASVLAYAALVNAAGGSAVTASEGAVGHSANGLNRNDLVSFFQAHP